MAPDLIVLWMPDMIVQWMPDMTPCFRQMHRIES